MRIRALLGALAGALAITAVAVAAPADIPGADDEPLELPIAGDGFFDVSQPPDQYNDNCALGDLGGPYQDDAGFSPASDVESEGGDTDAFDGGLVLWVRNKSGRGVFEDSNARGALDGTELRVGPESVRGLRVTRFERTFPQLTTLRSLIKLKNPSRRKTARRTIIWDSDLGADGSEVVAASSSGDTILRDGDRWMVFDESDGSDPLGTFVLYGKGARKQTRVFNPVVDVDSCISFSAAVRIPPRSTRYLLFFTEAHDSDDLAGAKADARRYNDRKPAKVLKGLSRAVKRSVLNWDLG